ncbi:hypothetical protein RB195_020659 [Necator americanus]|uniref:Uncharacterized protein n=1 Tax=Necator americanus TaxID=51031 RepID=A0ABR1CJU9_NECAM
MGFDNRSIYTEISILSLLAFAIAGSELNSKLKDRRPWLRNVVRLNLRKFGRKRRSRLFSDGESLRVRRSPHRLIASNILKSDAEFLEVSQQKVAPALLEATTSSPAHKLSTLFVSLFSKVSASELPKKWSTTYKKMLELQKKLEENEKLPGARVYDAAIYDLVTNDRISTEHSNKSVPFIPPFLKDVMGVVNSFSGGENARILSPRLAPLMPSKERSRGLLSPAVFPFYKDDSEQQILPIPKVLEDSGLNEKDRENVLEMIIEVSGARETVDNAMKVLNHLSSLGIGEELLSASEKIGESFEALRASFNNVQKKDLDQRGFTFMEVEQMRKLHKSQGLKEPEIDIQIEHYAALPKSKRMKALWETVSNIAGIHKRRSKRQGLASPSILQPTVLSPYQFAPVFGLSVLVLCPDVISPMTLGGAVLSPSVLSPAVLSKSYFMVAVLSPSVLS